MSRKTSRIANACFQAVILESHKGQRSIPRRHRKGAFSSTHVLPTATFLAIAFAINSISAVGVAFAAPTQLPSLPSPVNRSHDDQPSQPNQDLSTDHLPPANPFRSFAPEQQRTDRDVQPSASALPTERSIANPAALVPRLQSATNLQQPPAPLARPGWENQLPPPAANADLAQEHQPMPHFADDANSSGANSNGANPSDANDYSSETAIQQNAIQQTQGDFAGSAYSENLAYPENLLRPMPRRLENDPSIQAMPRERSVLEPSMYNEPSDRRAEDEMLRSEPSQASPDAGYQAGANLLTSDDAFANQDAYANRQVAYASPQDFGNNTSGAVRFADPEAAAQNALRGAAPPANGNSATVPLAQAPATKTTAELSPLEKNYSDWWRAALSKSTAEGQPLELYQLLRQVEFSTRAKAVVEYWRIAEAIVQQHIQEESLAQWNDATKNRSEDMVIAVKQILEQEVSLAKSNVQASQSRISSILERSGLPAMIRPIDAPFLGPYDCKLGELIGSGENGQLGILAAEIDKLKQEILDDENSLQWAIQEWNRAKGNGAIDRLAAITQLRQNSFLLLNRRVTQYNATIAQYALAVAGPGPSTERQIAMLLRQPIVGGTLMDIRTDPMFQNASGHSSVDPGMISRLGWDGTGYPMVSQEVYSNPLANGNFIDSGAVPVAYEGVRVAYEGMLEQGQASRSGQQPFGSPMIYGQSMETGISSHPSLHMPAGGYAIQQPLLSANANLGASRRDNQRLSLPPTASTFNASPIVPSSAAAWQSVRR